MRFSHLGELVHVQAKQYKNKTAIKFQNYDKKWTNMSWKDLSSKVMKTAQAMAEIKIKPKENVGIYSQNMAIYLVTDFAAYANRAVMVPMYATSSPSQVEYIVKDANIRVLFVGEQFQYNNAYKVKKESSNGLQLIVFDKNVVLKTDDETTLFFDDFITLGDNSESSALVNARLRQLKGSDLANIIYTSGTTGEPKGVMLDHDNYMAAFKLNVARLTQMSEKDLSMCFLPLTHIFEKAWSYLCLASGITIAINQDPTKIQETIKQIRPTVMSNVPRFWEKVYDGIQERIETSSGILRWLFNDSVATGRRHNLEYKNKNKTAPLGNTLKFWFYKLTIFNIIKRVVGIDRGNFFPVAGAPLSDKINEFMQSIDVHIIYGYGLSETTATVSCFTQTGFTIGTVGTVLPGVDVKIGDNNEILIKGDTIMKGYYNKPEATAEAFTEDGFFRTGDAGKITENGEITLTERIKDLYKTSNGKYIAPQMIETKMIVDKYIDQVAVIGDERKFVSALIVPNFDKIREYAIKHKIEFQSNEDLASNVDIHDYIFGRIELNQAQFTNYEKIKKIVILARPFSMEEGELTNTLKLKRKTILERYADEINSMYKE